MYNFFVGGGEYEERNEKLTKGYAAFHMGHIFCML